MMVTAGTLLSAAVTVLAVLLGLYTMMLVGRNAREARRACPGDDRCSRI
jgi:hypothetical protein